MEHALGSSSELSAIKQVQVLIRCVTNALYLETQRTIAETHLDTHRDTHRDTQRDTQRHTKTHTKTQTPEIAKRGNRP